MRRLFYFVIVSVMATIGCQNNTVLTFDETEASDSHMRRGMSEEHAVTVAKNFIGSLYAVTRSSSTIEVADVYAWKRSDLLSSTRSLEMGTNLPDTLFYIVNFKDDGGFVLVSATDTIGTIVAYVESGHLKPSDEISNPGFRLYIDNLCYVLCYNSPTPTNPIPDDTVIVVPDHVNPNFPGNPLPWNIDTVVGPLLTTKWGQEYPFNTYCFTNEGYQALAGCGPIALSQIAAYYSHPSSRNGHVYNWTEIKNGYIPTSATGKESAAQLVHDAGIYTNAVYGTEVTSVIAYLYRIGVYSFGFDFSTSYSAISFNTLMQNINDGKPIIISGYDSTKECGHTWVIDGYLTRWRPGPSLGNNPNIVTQKLVHCNWGWYGIGNGYFLYNNLSLQNMMLTDNLSWENLYVGDSLTIDSDISCFYNLVPRNE